MNSFRLLISNVPHSKGEKLTRAAMESGCRGGTVLMGRGLARTNLAAVLGLGETPRDIIMMLVGVREKKSVLQAIVKAASKEKKGFGEVFSIDAASVLKAGNLMESSQENGEKTMDQTKPQNEMITVIVNKGYADDVMAAARKAGAGGGTVLNARGTARETDERFFGMHIVPEKEMLIMVVSAEKKEAVMNAIRELKCLSQLGMGIAYSSEVEDFSSLGKAAKK